MSIVTRDITIAANGSMQMARKSDFLRCLSSSAPVKVQFNNGDGGDLEGGLAYFPEGGFNLVRISNPNATSVTLSIALGKGSMTDSRSTVNTGQNLPVQERVPDTMNCGSVSLPGTGAVIEIMSADPLRKEAVITVDAVSGVYCFMQSGNGIDGNEIQAGQSISVTTNAAIYMRNGTSTPVNVRWTALGFSS